MHTKYKRLIVIITLLFGSFAPVHVSALEYSNSTDTSFTINPSITVTLSSSDLVIDELAPSTAQDSNSIVINVLTNNINGYQLSSTVGGDRSSSKGSNSNNSYAYGSTSLVNSTNNDHAFTSLSPNDNLSELSDFTPGTWGYSYSNDSGSTWSAYSGLPLYTTTGTILSEKYTPSNDNINFKIAAYATNTQALGEYHNVINFTATAYPNPITLAEAYAYFNKPQVDNHYTMQDMTPSICGIAEEGSELEVVDIRDHEIYHVAKLKDNKCWMTTNLDLPGGTVLSADNTNVTEDYINSFSTSNNLTKVNNTIVLPASSTSGFDTNNYSYVYNSGNRTDNCASPGCYSYYSWDAATLGSGRSITTDNTDAPYSICPANWHLPNTYNGTNSSTDYRAFLIALGGSNSIIKYDSATDPRGSYLYDRLVAPPYNFKATGDYKNGVYESETQGFFWTSTSASDARARTFGFWDSSTVGNPGRYYREVGYAIRCIAN